MDPTKRYSHSINYKLYWTSCADTTLGAVVRRPKKYDHDSKILVGHNSPTRYVQADVTVEAQGRRIIRLQVLLMKRGKFSKRESVEATRSREPATKETAARWLSAELEKLRKAETRSGASSRLDIADLAQTMLECLDGPPGDELLCLVQSLLNIDRHRKQLARSENFVRPATYEGLVAARNQSLSARELARKVGVTQPAISGWRLMDAYKELTEIYREFFRQQFKPFLAMAAAKNSSLPLSELYRVAMAMEHDSLKKRFPNIEEVSISGF